MKKLNFSTYIKLLKQGKKNLILLQTDDNIYVTNKKTGKTYFVTKKWYDTHKEKYDTPKVNNNAFKLKSVISKSEPKNIAKNMVNKIFSDTQPSFLSQKPKEISDELKYNASHRAMKKYKEEQEILKSNNLTPEIKKKLQKVRDENCSYTLAAHFSHAYNVGFTDDQLDQFHKLVTKDRKQNNIPNDMNINGKYVIDDVSQLNPEYAKYFPRTYKYLKAKKQAESTHYTPKFVPPPRIWDYEIEKADAIARVKNKRMPKKPGKQQDQYMYDKYVLGSDSPFTFAGLHSYEEGPDGKTRFFGRPSLDGTKQFAFAVNNKNKDQLEYLKNIVHKNEKKNV